mgnify:CR=1 FL=1
MPDSVTRTFFESGLVPVVVLTQAEKGVALARAIQAGGLNSIEITLRTSAALEAIRQTVCQAPDNLVGAGTVQSVAIGPSGSGLVPRERYPGVSWRFDSD